MDAPTLTLPPDATSKEVPLSCGRFALVDAADFDLVAPHRWHSLPGRNTRYAFMKVRLPDGRRTSLYMHRFILSTPRGMKTDHRNDNGLDNRRDNLRVCTNQQNLLRQRPSKRSASGLRGVHAAGKKWLASLMVDGQVIRLGVFDDPIEAARAYDAAAAEHCGEFAYLNFAQGV